ncbi:MAG: hypothetical protein R6V67_03880, partial [Spirochaetia bacterium]
IYRGMWNPVIKVYSVTFEENRTFFEDFSSFLQFFTATALSLSLLREDMQDFDNNYLLPRVTVIPRVPEPPFTLLAPFLPDLSLSSPWEEVPLEYQGREE